MCYLETIKMCIYLNLKYPKCDKHGKVFKIYKSSKRAKLEKIYKSFN